MMSHLKLSEQTRTRVLIELTILAFKCLIENDDMQKYIFGFWRENVHIVCIRALILFMNKLLKTKYKIQSKYVECNRSEDTISTHHVIVWCYHKSVYAGIELALECVSFNFGESPLQMFYSIEFCVVAFCWQLFSFAVHFTVDAATNGLSIQYKIIFSVLRNILTVN